MNAKQQTLIDTAPDYAKATSDLISWSENYDYPSPASLYLDMIGWSEDSMGERLCSEKFPSLGYLELGMIAEALTEYANRPADVGSWVDELMNAGNEDEDDETI